MPRAPGGRLTSVSPARLSDIVAEVGLGDAGTLAAGARAARAAQPGWADMPAPVRGRAIAHIGRLVEANAQALAALVTREIGKPYAEALGEVREIADTCNFFLGEGRRLYGQTVPSEMPDKQLFTARGEKGLSWRQLAKEIGVSASTISRMANGLKPDVSAFAAMTTWLRMPAETFYATSTPQTRGEDEPELLASLVPLLRARRDLDESDVAYLEEVIGAAARRFRAERDARSS